MYDSLWKRIVKAGPVKLHEGLLAALFVLWCPPSPHELNSTREFRCSYHGTTIMMAAVTCSVIAVRHRTHTEYIETGDTNIIIHLQWSEKSSGRQEKRSRRMKVCILLYPYKNFKWAHSASEQWPSEKKNFYTQNQSQWVSVTIVNWYLIILKCFAWRFLS